MGRYINQSTIDFFEQTSSFRFDIVEMNETCNEQKIGEFEHFSITMTIEVFLLKDVIKFCFTLLSPIVIINPYVIITLVLIYKLIIIVDRADDHLSSY